MVTLQFSVLDFTGGNDSLVIIAGDTSSKTVANFTNATGNYNKVKLNCIKL